MPQPPRTTVLPLPFTSQANPVRGPTLVRWPRCETFTYGSVTGKSFGSSPSFDGPHRYSHRRPRFSVRRGMTRQSSCANATYYREGSIVVTGALVAVNRIGFFSFAIDDGSLGLKAWSWANVYVPLINPMASSTLEW